MESGAGAERHTARFDALVEDAKAAIGYAANEVRALTERARQVAAEPGDGPQDGRTLEEPEGLARLETVVASLERLWLFLGGGAIAGATAAEDSLLVLEAQDAERARIAQEIHDGPAQALANMAFRIDILDRVLERDPAAARAELAGLREALDSDLDDLRGLINQLRPRQLDELGLDGALREAAEELQAGHHVRVDLRAASERLDERQQTVVLRVAQEALRNVRKHARARRVALTTTDDTRGWTLEVADDGEGFDVPDTLRLSAGRSFGLRFMRERAETIGASLSIDSGSTGTRVRLTITPDGERSSAW